MPSQIQQLKNLFDRNAFWIFVSLSCLATINIYFIWQITEKAPPLSDYLGWAAIFYLLWMKRNKIKYRGNLISSLIGMLLVVWMLVRQTLVYIYTVSPSLDILSGFFRFVALMGILLIISGFRGLKNYIPEIIVSLTSATLYLVNTPILGNSKLIAIIDANLTAFMLHYIGFKVTRQDEIVSLPNGAIEIFTSCSSISPMATIFPILIAFLFVYDTSKKKKILVCASTVICIFFINAIRLSLLAIYANQRDPVGLEYWHGGDGNSIVSNVIVLVVAGLAYLMALLGLRGLMYNELRI